VRYGRLLAQGWVDAVRSRHPEERIYTFWDYFRDHWKRNAGLRIDHLLLNAELAAALTDAGVDTWVRDRPHASDHAPTWTALDLARAQRKAREVAAPRVRKGDASRATAKKRRPAKR
jgi:exodeoxyribonuclease-3